MKNSAHRGRNRSRSGTETWFAGILLVAICVQPLSAQQNDSANRALRKAQGMLRQLSTEKQALETRNAELQTEIDSLKNDVASTQSAVTQEQAMTAAVREQNLALTDRIRSDYGKMQAIIQKYREKEQELALYKHDHQLLLNAVGERDEWMANCELRNASLIDAGKDLLKRYDEKSVWDSISASEPVLGLGKVNVEIENQEYRFKLEDLKVQLPEKQDLDTRATRAPEQSGEAATR